MRRTSCWSGSISASQLRTIALLDTFSGFYGTLSKKFGKNVSRFENFLDALQLEKNPERTAPVRDSSFESAWR